MDIGRQVCLLDTNSMQEPPFAAKMPSWPLQGSVAKMEDVFEIKLSEPYPAPDSDGMPGASVPVLAQSKSAR